MLRLLVPTAYKLSVLILINCLKNGRHFLQVIHRAQSFASEGTSNQKYNQSSREAEPKGASNSPSQATPSEGPVREEDALASSSKTEGAAKLRTPKVSARYEPCKIYPQDKKML